MSPHHPPPPDAPGFRRALLFWLKLGLIGFGGPAAQIAIMHRELVVAKRWIAERHFLAGLDLCMLLPGPEAQQLAAILCSAITTWTTFLPGLLLVLLAAPWLERLTTLPSLSAALTAITAAVTGLILHLAISFAASALRHEDHTLDLFTTGIAATSFLLLRTTPLPLALVVALAPIASIIRHFW
jgi:chromate transporter